MPTGSSAAAAGCEARSAEHPADGNTRRLLPGAERPATTGKCAAAFRRPHDCHVMCPFISDLVVVNLLKPVGLPLQFAPVKIVLLIFGPVTWELDVEEAP